MELTSEEITCQDLERLKQTLIHWLVLPERTLSILHPLCVQNGGIWVFFLFGRWTTSPLLISHSSAGLTHTGFTVGTLCGRKPIANQVAPGRKTPFHGYVIVFQSVSNTRAFLYGNCLIPVKGFTEGSMLDHFLRLKKRLFLRILAV